MKKQMCSRCFQPKIHLFFVNRKYPIVQDKYGFYLFQGICITFGTEKQLCIFMQQPLRALF